MSEATEVKVPNNEIRVGNRTKPKDLIAQCEKLLKEDKLKEIHLTAVGNSIGDLIIAVEILKSSNPGLNQQTIFSTIGPRTPKNANKDKEKEKDKENEKPQKLYPHLEVVLSCEKLEMKEAPKLTEEERKILIDTLDKQKANFNKQRKFNSFKRRRNFRFGFRRQRFALSARRNVNNRYNRNARNWSYNTNNKRRPRQGYNNNRMNNRRVFPKSPAGRRFNNKSSNPVNPSSRNQSAKKEPAKN